MKQNNINGTVNGQSFDINLPENALKVIVDLGGKINIELKPISQTSMVVPTVIEEESKKLSNVGIYNTNCNDTKVHEIMVNSYMGELVNVLCTMLKMNESALIAYVMKQFKGGTISKTTREKNNTKSLTVNKTAYDKFINPHINDTITPTDIMTQMLEEFVLGLDEKENKYVNNMMAFKKIESIKPEPNSYEIPEGIKHPTTVVLPYDYYIKLVAISEINGESKLLTVNNILMNVSNKNLFSKMIRQQGDKYRNVQASRKLIVDIKEKKPHLTSADILISAINIAEEQMIVDKKKEYARAIEYAKSKYTI